MLEYESAQAARSKRRDLRAFAYPLMGASVVALASGIACMSRVRANDYNLALFAGVVYGVGTLAVVVGIAFGIASLVMGPRTGLVLAALVANCVLLMGATWLAYAWLYMLL